MAIKSKSLQRDLLIMSNCRPAVYQSDKEAYPSPTTSSPSSPCIQRSVVSALSKRKSIPKRSLPCTFNKREKYVQGIVKLDVYTLYLSNPTKLIKSVQKNAKIDLGLYKNTANAPIVVWKKGGVLNISPSEEMYGELTPEEVNISSILRILPAQYLYIKETILSKVRQRGPFKKRDAKSWFRIDVNKVGIKFNMTAILFDWFRALGWIPSDSDWEHSKSIYSNSLRNNSS